MPGIVTTTLIVINVGIYLLQLAGGASINANSGWIYEHGALFIERIDSSGQIVGLAHGEWYRLLTAAFLHYGPIHLGDEHARAVVDRPAARGLPRPVRYLMLYLVSGIAGSAGALLVDPGAITVGASGAIFGILGAALVLERQRTLRARRQRAHAARGQPRVHVRRPGHLDRRPPRGTRGGALGILAISRFGRGSAAYGRSTLVSIVSLVAIGVVSVAVAYWKVQGATA